jgi:hypothetical protein
VTVEPVLGALSEVLAPIAILVAASVVIVVTLVVSHHERRPPDPEAVLWSSGPVGRWRVEHGSAIDAWLDAYGERFAGLADALAGRVPLDVPEPVERTLEGRLEAAAESSPDSELGERLLAMQASAQSALVATVAGRIPAAADAYERYLAVRASALDRLGALMADPSIAEPT